MFEGRWKVEREITVEPDYGVNVECSDHHSLYC